MLSRSIKSSIIRPFFSAAGIKTIISSPDAPKAIGPYSQGIKANGFVYVSGCLGLDPKVYILHFYTIILDK